MYLGIVALAMERCGAQLNVALYAGHDPSTGKMPPEMENPPFHLVGGMRVLSGTPSPQTPPIFRYPFRGALGNINTKRF